jgi:hypothetical protein
MAFWLWQKDERQREIRAAFSCDCSAVLHFKKVSRRERGDRSADKAATKGILQKETKETKKQKILPRMRNSLG